MKNINLQETAMTEAYVSPSLEMTIVNTETGFCSSAETESFIEGEEAGFVFE